MDLVLEEIHIMLVLHHTGLDHYDGMKMARQGGLRVEQQHHTSVRCAIPFEHMHVES